MTLRILGISDDVTTCECCGRSDLRKTVALGDSNGYVKYYGCECAAKAIAKSGGRRMNGAKVEKIASNVNTPKYAKAQYAVINEKTGIAITKCFSLESAQQSASIRGDGYFAAYVG